MTCCSTVSVVSCLPRAGCGEEELLLDALSVCGPALACLGALLAPAALLALGLLPEEASLEARRPPYLLRLTLHRVSGPPTALPGFRV